MDGATHPPSRVCDSAAGACFFYIHARKIKKARRSGDWNAVFAGAALFGTDFLFETINAWIFHFTGRSALWTTAGDTALRTLVG